MFKLTLLTVAALAASLASAETAYFTLQTVEEVDFVIKLTDDAKITEARRILSGEEKEKIHVAGKIIKSRQAYNPSWSYHLDPSTIDFFDLLFQTCESTFTQAEENLNVACGAFLPGCLFCPQTSKLIRENK